MELLHADWLKSICRMGSNEGKRFQESWASPLKINFHSKSSALSGQTLPLSLIRSFLESYRSIPVHNQARALHLHSHFH
ncbi:hypothetical protein E2C01_081058 [Portunus trituberculatus]|uniref:Uncharacterized protein n=1 Tax=Portunus trituberculatus TaxID=210409 RepID=A0A5B7IX00_PORTR|nr:hypothetical protein [Portunus trituberculatus]